MLNWLIGGGGGGGGRADGGTEGTAAGAATGSSQQHQHYQQQQQQQQQQTTSGTVERVQTPPPATPDDADYRDLDQVPQTPAAMFAVKAFRTAIFGTPAPKQPVQSRLARAQPVDVQEPLRTTPLDDADDRQQHQQQRPTTTAASVATITSTATTTLRAPSRRQEKRPEEDEERIHPRPPSRRQKLAFQGPSFESADPAPFKLASHNGNLFDATASKSSDLPAYLTQGTPARPMSPTKGILLTPGLAMRQRKAVTFDPTTKDEEVKPKSSRPRSGLPMEFPGKFPSPYTPRSSLPKRSSGSLEETSLPIESASKKRAITFQVTEASRIQDILAESDEDDEKMRIMHEAELTTDITSPKSASGKYWKEHAENLESVALAKVDKLRGRCNLAIEYAKRKDDYCVNLSDKLREYIEKNRLLKNEIKRLHQAEQISNAGSEGTALSDAMRMLAEKEARIGSCESEMSRMQVMIEQYENRLKTYEDLLDDREEKITEMSMTMFDGGFDDADSEEVKELKQKLRKARLEAKELGPIRVELRNAKSRIAILEREKESLEAQLERMKSVGDESTPRGRSSTETRLRARIDELEKEKRDLKAEMRAKVSEASKHNRESEKTLRAEITNFRSKLMAEELDRKDLVYEAERLRETIATLERDLAKAKSQRAESQFAFANSDHDEWQRKQRSTAQELRQAKEEIATLRQQLERPDDAAAPLRLRRPSPVNSNPTSVPTTTAAIPAAIPTTEKPEARSTPPQKHGEMMISTTPTSDDSAIDRSYDHNNRKLSTASHASARKSPTFGMESKPMSPTHLQGIHEHQQQHVDFSVGLRKPRASPRPSVVTWEVSPGSAKRRTFAVTKKSSFSSKADAGGIFADPARVAAAERRVAERRAKRMAERMAAKSTQV